MSKKFEDFKQALEGLCRQYGVQIVVSYDTIDICDLPEGEPPIWGTLLDRTVDVNKRDAR